MTTEPINIFANNERQLNLLLYIQDHPYTTREQIFQNVSGYKYDSSNIETLRKRLQRDKEELESWGFVISCDHNQYFIDKDQTFSNPITIDDSYANFLRFICWSLLNDSSYPAKAELQQILVKLSDLLDAPDRLPFSAGDITQASKQKRELTKIRFAIEHRKTLEFTYTKPDKTSSIRKVEPFGIFTLEDNIYLVAFDCNRQAERVFRLDRLKKPKCNNTSEPEFEPREFNAHDWIKLPFQLGSTQGEAIIQIASDKPITSVCHEYGKIISQDDGTLYWQVDYASEENLISWCIQHGPHIIPVQPESLQRNYKLVLQQLLENPAFKAGELDG